MLIDDDDLITFPDNFCTLTRSKNELIQCVFPNLIQNYTNHDWLSERAILAAKNVDVNEINFNVLQTIPGVEMVYRSVDTMVDENETVNYPTKFLNSLDLPGVPPHFLRLKVGTPIIMLRNLHPPKLCNGTRLVVRRLLNFSIEATIIVGKYKGENILIPRIPIIPNDMPFELVYCHVMRAKKKRCHSFKLKKNIKQEKT